MPERLANRPAGWSDGAFLALILVVTWWLTGPTALPDADAGEFVVLAAQGGIPHPPGYPLLMLLLRLVAPLRAWVPVVPLLSSVSVVAVAVAAWVMQRVLLEMTGSRMGAWLACWTVFLSAPVWRDATTVEPFGLNLLQAALVLLCTWRFLDDNANRARWALLLGVGFGTGVCNHHSLAFLAPATLVILGMTSWRKRDARPVAAFLVGGVLGLVPLVYLFTTDSQTALSWGDTSARGWWWRHLLRADYGTFSLKHGAGGMPSALPLFLRGLPGALSVGAAVLVGLGVWQATRARDGKLRGFLVVNVVHLVLLLGVFMTLARLESDGTARLIIQRFFALPLVLLAPWILLGWQVVTERVPERMAHVVAVAFMLIHVSLQLPDAERRSEVFSDMHVGNALGHLPEGAVVVTGSDADYLALSYGREVLGLAPTTVITTVSLWDTPWYRARVRQRVPELGDGSVVTSLQPVVAVRPVMFTAGALQFLGPGAPRTVPHGVFQRMLREDEDADWERVFRDNVALFERYRFPATLDELTAWESVMLHDYWWTWKKLSDALAPRGDEKAAEAQRMRMLLEQGLRPMM
ncbi:MAG: DUF2723 domain-containing protein [Myxococcota bacterium]